MSNPHSPEPARWILEMSAPDIPAWNRAFTQLERKPLTALEEMLVQSFDRYLRRKAYLTKRQVEVLQGIARKHNVPLPLIPPITRQTESSHSKQEPNLWSSPLLETKEPIEVVKPEVLARWRQWGVPEEVIDKTIKQRTAILKARRVEERVTLPDFAYTMPRLPEIEAQSWGFAKAIDYEGYIGVKDLVTRDRTERIDRWLYRYEYYTPRIIIATKDYEPIEEMANMMHVSVRIWHMYDHRTERYIIVYRAEVRGARAVMVCHLIEPYLKIPKKKASAKQILAIYRRSPLIKVT